MSIALERSRNRIEPAGIVRGVSCVPIYDAPEGGGGRRMAAGAPPPSSLRKSEGGPGVVMPAAGRGAEGEEEEEASCSSSIGRDSDGSGGSAGSSDGEDSGEPEVRSAPKGPLDTTAALEDALPFRRGISKFYCGKSKSFASLGDVSSSSSATDLAKPDNAYTRKRKNLLAFSINWERPHRLPPASTGGGMPKRPANSSRSTAPCGSNGAEGEDQDPRRLRPPLHPKGKVSPPSRGGASPPKRCHFSARSFSLTDLQGATSSVPSSIIPGNEDRGIN